MEKVHYHDTEPTGADKLLVTEQLLNVTGDFAAEIESGENKALTVNGAEYAALRAEMLDALYMMAEGRGENEHVTKGLLPKDADEAPLSDVSAAVNARMREWYKYGLMVRQEPALDEFIGWLLKVQQMAHEVAGTPTLARSIERALWLTEVRLGITTGDFHEA